MRREMLTSQHLEAGELEIIENGGVMFSPTELIKLIKTGQIPLIDPARFDERRYCKYAINGDEVGAAGCPCWRIPEEGSPDYDEEIWSYCSLNGRERRDPCVFDEPDDAPVWAAIRAYVARWG